jgi:uncharacterized membrane protein YozB (DUF420 family)
VLALALAIAALSAAGGHLAAIFLVPAALTRATGFSDLGAVSSAGMMAVASGLTFFFALAAVRLSQRGAHAPSRAVLCASAQNREKP